MSNSIKENKIREPKSNSSFQVIADWDSKINFLKKQIAAFEKLEEFPAIFISAFILKSQLIEFELKQLIISLDLYLVLQNRIHNRSITTKTRTPKDINNMKPKWTLGRLINEIEKYKFPFLKKMGGNLRKLRDTRNKFIHKLFDIGNLDQLIMEVKAGLKLSGEIISDINSVRIFMKNEPRE